MSTPNDVQEALVSAIAPIGAYATSGSQEFAEFDQDSGWRFRMRVSVSTAPGPAQVPGDADPALVTLQAELLTMLRHLVEPGDEVLPASVDGVPALAAYEASTGQWFLVQISVARAGTAAYQVDHDRLRSVHGLHRMNAVLNRFPDLGRDE